jgi:hypothetical protein
MLRKSALASRLLPAAGATLLIAFGCCRAVDATAAAPLGALAKAFVSLSLQLGHVPGHESEVDSYFGPPGLLPAVAAPPRSLAELSAAAGALVTDIVQAQQRTPDERAGRLLDQVRSLAALTAGLAQTAQHGSFAQEAWAMYGMRMPAVDGQAIRHALQALDALLPGTGAVAARLDDYRMRFVVAPQRRHAVFERALRACRERTLQHWALPADERLEVQWSDDVPAAWQRYRGGDHSTLQINSQAVAFVGEAIDVACHEAYPGHHAQFLLLTQRAGRAGLPVEDTIALLHAPASVLREGAANFGIELAFPLQERIRFDREVLFPLARLDAAEAERYERVNALVADLAVAAVPILAAYRDRHLAFGAAADQLRTQALVSSPEALLQFVDQEGAYTLGYTAARDRIRRYVQARSACTKLDSWQILAQIVAVPQIAALSEDGSDCT